MLQTFDLSRISEEELQRYAGSLPPSSSMNAFANSPLPDRPAPPPPSLPLLVEEDDEPPNYPPPSLPRSDFEGKLRCLGFKREIIDEYLDRVYDYESNTLQPNFQRHTMITYLRSFKGEPRLVYSSKEKGVGRQEYHTHTTLLPNTRGDFAPDGEYAYLCVEECMFLDFATLLANDFLQGNIWHYQEVIRSPNNPLSLYPGEDFFRLFADLDSESPITDKDVQQVVEAFVTKYRSLHITTPDNPEVIVLRNNAEGQRKVHIHFPTLYTTKDGLKLTAKKVKEEHPEFSFVDTNYSGLRTLLCGKVHYLPNGRRAANNLSYYAPSTSSLPRLIIALLKTRIRCFTWECRENPLKPEWRKKIWSCLRYERIPLYSDVLTRMYMIAETFDGYETEEEETLLRLKRKSLRTAIVCPVCKRVHDNDNLFLFYIPGQIRLYCFRGEKSIFYESFISSEVDTSGELEIGDVALPSSLESSLPSEVYNKMRGYALDLFPGCHYRRKSDCIDIYTLSGRGNNHCPVCSYPHAVGHRIFTGSGKIILICWEAKRERRYPKTKDLEQYRKETEEDKIKREIWWKHQLLRDRYAHIHSLTPQEYSEESIRDLSPNQPIQVIISSMSTEKSRKTRKFIQECPELIKSAVFLTARRTYARSLHHELQSSGIPSCCYLDNKNFDTHCAFPIIQMESLHRLNSSYDLVVVDEASAVCEQMNSKYHKVREHNRARLRQIIAEARFVLLLDAYMGKCPFFLLRDLRPHNPIHVQRNTIQKRQGWTAIKVLDRYMLETLLLREVRSGKKVVVCCRTKRQAERLAALLRRVVGAGKLRLYCEGANLSDLEDVNASWIKLSVLIYTSTITVGIDFNGLRCSCSAQPSDHFHPHFDTMFLFTEGNGCSVEDMKQMMGRVRDLRENRIYYLGRAPGHLLSPTGYSPIAYQEVREQILHQIEANEHAVLQHFSPEIVMELLQFRNSHRLWETKEDVWFKLFVESKREHNKSRRFFHLLLQIILEEQGYTLLDLLEQEISPQSEIDAVTQAFDNASTEQLFFTDEQWNRAVILSGARLLPYEERVEAGRASEEDHIILKKSRLAMQFDPAFYGQLSGSGWRILSELMPQVKLTLLELQSAEEVLRHDLFAEKPRIGNKIMVDLICRWLGFQNTLDRTSFVTCAAIREKLNNWIKLYPLLSDLFSLPRPTGKGRNPSPHDYRSVLKMLERCLRSWNGMELKAIEQPRAFKTKRTFQLFLTHKNSDFIQSAVLAHTSLKRQEIPSGVQALCEQLGTSTLSSNEMEHKAALIQKWKEVHGSNYQGHLEALQANYDIC